MSIHKTVDRKNPIIASEGIGVKLGDVANIGTPDKQDVNMAISGYSGDVARSVMIGGAALAIELVLYFSNLIK
ncbi:MAG: hypothetical protein M3P33_00185 [bacterium]|nr:hypothetical protein [bacterium]